MYRSLLVSLLLIGAVTTLITQTGASFVDSGTSTSNTFTAGKVDLQVTWSSNPAHCVGLNGINGFISMNVPKMLPGDSATQSVSVLDPNSAGGGVGCPTTYSTLPLRYSATSFSGVAISGVSAGNPTTITTAANHNLHTGDIVTIVGAGTTPAIAGSYPVTVNTATQFTIPVSTTGGGSVGSVQPMLASQLILSIKYQKHLDCNSSSTFNSLASGSITGAALGGGGATTITMGSALPNLANGDHVALTGSAYNGTWPVSGVTTGHGAVGTISSMTSAKPAVITSTISGSLAPGDVVRISGTPSHDGDWVVSGATSSTFTIPATGDSSTSSGTVTKLLQSVFTIPPAFTSTSTGTATAQDGIAYQGPLGSAAGQALWSTLANNAGGGDRLIPVGGRDRLCFNVALPASSPDIFQSASSTLTFQFSAQQQANNP